MGVSEGVNKEPPTLSTATVVYVHKRLQSYALSFSSELCDVNFVSLRSRFDWGPNKERFGSEDDMN